MPTTRATPSSSRSHAVAGLHAGRHGARPERDDGRLELHGDVDRARELADAALAALGEQRRVVLAARVEREAGAGLHDAGELELVEQPPQRGGAAAHAGRVGVEVDVVERQRDAAVAAVGEQPDGVLEPVAGQPVGDVGVVEPADRTLRAEAGRRGHVTFLRRASVRASGHSAAMPPAGASPPDVASIPASSGIRPSTDGADGLLQPLGRGVLDRRARARRRPWRRTRRPARRPPRAARPSATSSPPRAPAAAATTPVAAAASRGSRGRRALDLALRRRWW